MNPSFAISISSLMNCLQSGLLPLPVSAGGAYFIPNTSRIEDQGSNTIAVVLNEGVEPAPFIDTYSSIHSIKILASSLSSDIVSLVANVASACTKPVPIDFEFATPIEKYPIGKELSLRASINLAKSCGFSSTLRDKSSTLWEVRNSDPIDQPSYLTASLYSAHYSGKPPIEEDSALRAKVLKKRYEYYNRAAEKLLDYDDVKKLIHYSPITGQLHWIHSIDPAIVPGDKASYENSNGQLLVKIRTNTYRASRVAWLLHTRSWPIGRLKHKDGNSLNLKWSNLEDTGSGD
jgi:hypothetical protein